MQFELGPSDRLFRDEVRAFIAAELPIPLRDRLRRGFFPTADEIRDWQRRLAARGWAAPGWPVEHGGTGWSQVRQLLFMSELFRAPAPEPFILNTNVAGPLIIKYGSSEQKAQFLPGMLTLDIWFCIGMSEPNAGSDLSSLATMAVRDGDVYVVNGQKIWTSTAHEANWMLALVRTGRHERKQDGISILLIDMTLPGIEVRPIVSTDGRHHFNEVFLRDVRVPAQQLLGEEGQGWIYARDGLCSERIGIARVGLAAERLDFLQQQREDGAVSPPPEEIARLAAELKALEVMQLTAISGESTGPAYASMLKLLGSELWIEINDLALSCHGSRNFLWAEDPYGTSAPGDATNLANLFSYSQAASIYGGTSEIQKNLIFRATFGARP